MQTIQVHKNKWFGKQLIETHYHIDVMGMSVTTPDKPNNNNMRFDKVFDHMPSNIEINRFIDEYHAMVRQSVGEQDWEKIDAAKKDAILKEYEEKRRKELEEEIAKEKAELEKKLKEKLEKDKIDMGK